jgi:hypothetical protein
VPQELNLSTYVKTSNPELFIVSYVSINSSPNIIRVIKTRRLRWVGHVARMRERRGAYRALVGNLRGGDHLEDSGVDGRIILKWIFERLGGGHGLDQSGLG